MQEHAQTQTPPLELGLKHTQVRAEMMPESKGANTANKKC